MSRHTTGSDGDTPRETRLVGRIVGLWRYPVKSMAGEALQVADVSWHGVAGDRRWAFVRPGVERSGFPWLTIRQRPDLVHYHPRLVDGERPDASPVVVRVPDGREIDVLDPALAANLGAARVMKQDRGVFDAHPLSLLTTGSVAGLGDLAGEPLDVRRFRPNVVVEPSGQDPFPEDGWVGAVLRIGEAVMRVDRRDPRCAVVNVDPETGRSAPAPLRAIARERGACLGVYGSTVQPGRVAVGDPVVVVA